MLILVWALITQHWDAHPAAVVHVADDAVVWPKAKYGKRTEIKATAKITFDAILMFNFLIRILINDT